jgi:hypothetical protein
MYLSKNLYILNITIINADNTSHTRITGLKVIYLSLLINTVKKLHVDGLSTGTIFIQRVIYIIANS